MSEEVKKIESLEEFFDIMSRIEATANNRIYGNDEEEVVGGICEIICFLLEREMTSGSEFGRVLRLITGIDECKGDCDSCEHEFEGSEC